MENYDPDIPMVYLSPIVHIPRIRKMQTIISHRISSYLLKGDQKSFGEHGEMELTRIFALSVMILIASYANTYLGKSAEKEFPCESTEQATNKS